MAFILQRQATVPNPYGSVIRVQNTVPGSLKGEWKANSGRTYTTVLKVQTNSKYVGSIQVIQSVAPVWGAYYRWPLTELGGDGLPVVVPVEQDTGSFLQSIGCVQDGDDGKQWIMTLEYGPFDVNHELGESDENGTHDPEKKPVEVSWTSAKYERSKPVDQDGNPFLNTVGDPFDDPPAIEESRPVLTIVRNEQVFNQSWIGQYVDRVNSDIFLGFAPNTVKCKDISGKREYEADWGYYWAVTYEFEFRDDPDGKGWTEQILNAGYRQKEGGTGEPKTVMIDGAPASQEVALQRDGSYVPGGAPYYLEFKLFKTANFTDFGFDPDLLTSAT